MSERTPSPWEAQNPLADESGVGIVGLPLNGLVALATMHPTEMDRDDRSRAIANATFIVDACNNHDRLTRENEAMRTVLENISNTFDESYRSGCLERQIGDKTRAVISSLKEA